MLRRHGCTSVVRCFWKWVGRHFPFAPTPLLPLLPKGKRGLSKNVDAAGRAKGKLRQPGTPKEFFMGGKYAGQL